MPEPVIRNMKLVPGPGRYTDLNFKLNKRTAKSFGIGHEYY